MQTEGNSHFIMRNMIKRIKCDLSRLVHCEACFFRCLYPWVLCEISLKYYSKRFYSIAIENKNKKWIAFFCFIIITTQQGRMCIFPARNNQFNSVICLADCINYCKTLTWERRDCLELKMLKTWGRLPVTSTKITSASQQNRLTLGWPKKSWSKI